MQFKRPKNSIGMRLKMEDQTVCVYEFEEWRKRKCQTYFVIEIV